jgi:hypothetical protein
MQAHPDKQTGQTDPTRRTDQARSQGRAFPREVISAD